MASLFYKIMLSLDGIVYDLVAYVYDIFDFLVGLNLFGNEDYNSIVSRIYLVLGVVMLFVLSYALLRAVINPEDFSKGDTSFKNIAKNIIISLIIIAFLPTVFTVAYNIQGAILNQHTIDKIILGDQVKNAVDENSNIRPGKEMAFYAFTSFFHPNEDWCLSEGIDFNNYQGSEGALSVCKRRIYSNRILFIGGDKNLEEMDSEVLNNNRSFAYYGSFSKSIGGDDGDKIRYTWLISTIAGGFLLYVLLNFCFDMALRVIKLMFYQLLAPIPVVCRAIPFGGLKDVFNKWVKNTIHTFLEVFIRIAVMYFAIFLIDLLVHVYPVYNIARLYGLGITQSLLVQALIIMAIVMFIRQAPKLIGDIFGIDSGSMKLGLMDKLAQGGAFAAGSAIGSGLGTAAKNFVRTRGSVRKKIFSAVGGLSSGTIRGFNQGRSAKNFHDMRKAVSTAQTNAENARTKRASRAERYQASGKNFITGHFSDALDTAKEFLYGDVLGKYNERIENAQKFDIRKQVRDWVLENDDAAKDANNRLKEHEAGRKTRQQFIDDELKLVTQRIQNSIAENGEASQDDLWLEKWLTEGGKDADRLYEGYTKKYWERRQELYKEMTSIRDERINYYAKQAGSDINRMIEEANMIRSRNVGDELFKGTTKIDVNNAVKTIGSNHNTIAGSDNVSDYVQVVFENGEPKIGKDGRYVPLKDNDGNYISICESDFDDLSDDEKAKYFSVRDASGSIRLELLERKNGTIEQFKGSNEYRVASENFKNQQNKEKN